MLVEIAGARAVDFDFGKQRKVDTVLRCRKCQDFGIAARLLGAELVTGKAQDREAPLGKIFVKGTQTCVLRRKASPTRDVDHQAQLVAKTAERHVLAGDGLHDQIMELRHGILLG